MVIEIPFDINKEVWYVDAKTMKAKKAKLKGVKVIVNTEGQNIKYNLDVPSPNEECYVWNVFKTKEDLLKSL